MAAQLRRRTRRETSPREKDIGVQYFGIIQDFLVKILVTLHNDVAMLILLVFWVRCNAKVILANWTNKFDSEIQTLDTPGFWLAVES